MRPRQVCWVHLLRDFEALIDRQNGGFVGIEPTNNAAERAIRYAVCWRKTSHASKASRAIASSNAF